MVSTNSMISKLVPELEELRKRIESSKALNSESIKAANITVLFMPLFGSDLLALTNMNFGALSENVLQVDASTTFYGKPLQIACVFNLADNKLNLTMNNIGDGLKFTLQEMVKDGLIPPSSSYPIESWPNVEIDGVSFVMDSSVKALVIKTGSGAQWDFLGYTNLFVDQPGINVVMTVSGPYVSYSLEARGSLKNKDGEVDIPVNIQFPIGLGSWMLSISAPVKLKNALDIIDALVTTKISELLPQTLAEKLNSIEIVSFSVKFDPVQLKILFIEIQIVTTEDWIIINDKLSLQKGITVNLNAQRYNETLSYSGSIFGSAEINYNDPDKIVANASIPIPLAEGSDWQIEVGNTKDIISLAKLIKVVPNVDNILPNGLVNQLKKIIIDSLKIKFRFNSGFEFTNVSFSIHSDESWQLPMLQSVVYLDDIKFELDVLFPYKAETTSGALSGKIQIADGEITIPVSIEKGRTDENWMLTVTSEKIKLPSIRDLSDFMGANLLVSYLPTGLIEIGPLSLYDLNLKWEFGSNTRLDLFSFTIQSVKKTPVWNLVPGYFFLTDLFISLVIKNTSVSDKDVSGSIGAIVNLALSKKKNLVLAMDATKPSSDKPWNFTGSLKEELELKELLLGLHLPDTVVKILPNLTITQFELFIEPTSGSFTTKMTIQPASPWDIISIDPLKISLTELFFKVEHYADNNAFEARGSFNIGTDVKKGMVDVSSTYEKEIWNFKGTYENKGDILTIDEVLKKYIINIAPTAIIPQLSITKISVDLEKRAVSTTATDVNYSKFDFSISGDLKHKDIPDFMISAIVNIQFDSRKETGKEYDGTNVKGRLTFGGLSFDVSSDFINGDFNEYTFKLVYKEITATCTIEKSEPEVKFNFILKSTDPNKILSFGNIISSFVEAATGEDPDIPSPWDFINKIPIDNFEFIFIYNKATKAKTVNLTYTPNINLGFISIKELSLAYKPEVDGNQGPVEFKVTKGTFLGKDIIDMPANEIPGWDLRNPQAATPVPGMGDSAFKLENLSLGNQVAIQGGTPPKSVKQAIEDLENAFKPEEKDRLPTTLYFDKDYGWLIGAQFTLIKYINISAIFYDPVIYGLSIDVKGGKFNGLNFQVLYKKVNDNVGVFHIDLTLPNTLRKQQYGAVSVTLPGISLSIYTNGDFLIDMGFPYNANFVRSFGLEFGMFTGAGGFYFGKLSNGTATDFNLPKTNGQFNPVIAFGIGIRAGVGRSVDKGVLKAELSLTIQVILEGIIAYYQSNTASGIAQNDSDEQYFRVQAQAYLVGRIYGEIDFIIISASVDITANIMAALLIIAYRQTEITFTAEVSASVVVRINLGLFSIKITLSQTMSVSDTFTVGSNSKAPWDLNALPDRRAYFTALDIPNVMTAPDMDWTAALDYPKSELNLLFLPQVSLKYKDGDIDKKQRAAVSLLYVNNDSDSGADTDFTALSRAFLAWTFNAYFSKKQGHQEKILDQPVTIDDLNAILDYFNQEKYTKDLNEPFSTDDLIKYFFTQSFTVVNINTINILSENAQDEPEQSKALFPMFPIFKMSVTDQSDIDFQEFGKCDATYLKRIKDYFNEMKVQFDDKQDASGIKRMEGQPNTLAEYLFIDYFVMIAKSGIQDAINNFKQTTFTVKEGESLDDLVKKYTGYGVSLQELSFANRHKPLQSGAKVRIPEILYHLKNGETEQHLIERFPELPTIKLLKTTDNSIINIPSFDYEIPVTNNKVTLRSLADYYNVDLTDLAAQNSAHKSLFAPGTKLIHSFVSTLTVNDILNNLQTGDKHCLSNIGGSITRFLLHGLRIPKDATTAERIGLYEASGQQFNFEKLDPDTEFSVSVQINKESTQADWLKFDKAGKTKFFFQTELKNAIETLVSSTYLPTMALDEQADVKRYRLQGKTFTLPDGIKWQNPNLMGAKTNLSPDYLWKFSSKLQQYLLDHPDLHFNLLLQSRNTSFSLEESIKLIPLFWSTSIQVKIQQIPSPASSGEMLDMVYEVMGCSEADGRLLQELILAKNPGIKDVHILFNENKSKDNKNGDEVTGYISDGLDKCKTFLLQTNYSTVSNPESSLKQYNPDTTPSNLIGMDAITFLTYLWECTIVRSGGYHLSYNNGSGVGLPGHIFDENGAATITILVSYKIPVGPETGAYKIPAYFNSVVIDKQLLPENDNLYLEVFLTDEQKEKFDPDLQDIHATILPGTGLFRGTRTNPALLKSSNLQESADKQLSELFNLVEYRINKTDGTFIESGFALPAGPTVVNESAVNCLSSIPRHALDSDGWIFSGVIPIYPFVIPPANAKGNQLMDDLQKDPYGANGKKATVYFNFLDVFGNTLNPGTGQLDDDGLTQDITPCYLDPVIGIDQWTNVYKYYYIDKEPVSEKPTLYISLEFDKYRYDSVKDPLPLAVRDLKLYQKIAYQLAQPDVCVNIDTNIGTLDAPVETPIDSIKNFVKNIMDFLFKIIHPTDDEPESIKVALPYFIDLKKLNPEFIFPLEVSIKIERTANIDPQFVNDPNIRVASSSITPDLYNKNTNDKTSPIDAFATMLESALPVMKVAVAQSKQQSNQTNTFFEHLAAKNSSSVEFKEVWLVRYAGTSGEPGIQFKVDPTPVYFATKPLSTKLISRPNEQQKNPVPIRSYISGTYLGDITPEDKTYAGIDIEVLARNFISAIDNFLSAEMGTKAWLAQYDKPGDRALDPKSAPFQVVEQAKKDIASAIARYQLTNILQDGSQEGIIEAQNALEQQLLINLDKAYSVCAVVQNKVTVDQGFDKPTASFYGKLKLAKESVPDNAYDFTPVKVPLTRHDPQSVDEPAITTLFSVRPETGQKNEISLIDHFEAKLDYHITHLEHNFGTPIQGYIPSSWLTLAFPIICGTDNNPFINADIPIPLKAYPTSPSMVKQIGVASYPEEQKIGKEDLKKVLQWDYAFNYDYVSAKQDLIYLNIRFNVKSDNLSIIRAEEPDLFESLMQFNTSYQAILADLEKGGPDSLIALQSFAWMAQQVGNAWSKWFDTIKNTVRLAERELDFVIQESEEISSGNLLLTITSAKTNPGPTPIPWVEIEGFETLISNHNRQNKGESNKDSNDSNTYCFVKIIDGTEEPLLYSDCKKYSQRILKLNNINILANESAWAGVSVHRNEILAEKPTNIDFRYITPYIRFVEPCLPSLYNQATINIADFTPEATKENKVKLETFLLNFFTKLLEGVTDPVVVIQLKCGYHFSLQYDNNADFMPLGPTLPILLTVPTSVSWVTPPEILTQIAETVNQWFKVNTVKGIDDDGQLNVELSIYSSLVSDIHNPMLQLKNLYLETKLIKLS